MAEPHRSARTRAIGRHVGFLYRSFPNPSAAHLGPSPVSSRRCPAFFTNGTYRLYLAPGGDRRDAPYARGEADACMIVAGAQAGMYFVWRPGYPALSPSLVSSMGRSSASANQLADDSAPGRSVEGLRR